MRTSFQIFEDLNYYVEGEVFHLIMNDSFNYFFSATPQVLGGIMALFGVFVLFKIQSFTSELLSIGQELEKDLTHYSRRGEPLESMDERVHMCRRVSIGILTKNVKYIHDALMANKYYQTTGFLEIRSRFDNNYTLYRSLIDKTVNSAILTGIVIVFCLSMIPLGKWICNKPLLLYTVFIITLLAVILVFYKFILIIKDALK